LILLYENFCLFSPQINKVYLFFLWFPFNSCIFFINFAYLLYTINSVLEEVLFWIQNEFLLVGYPNIWNHILLIFRNFLHFDELPIIEVTTYLDVIFFIVAMPDKCMFYFLLNTYGTLPLLILSRTWLFWSCFLLFFWILFLFLFFILHYTQSSTEQAFW